MMNSNGGRKMISLSALMNKKNGKECLSCSSNREKQTSSSHQKLFSSSQQKAEDDRTLAINILNSRVHSLESKVEILEAKVERSENYSLQLKLEVERLSKYVARRNNDCFIVNTPLEPPADKLPSHRPQSAPSVSVRPTTIKPALKKDTFTPIMENRRSWNTTIMENKRSSWYNDDNASFDEKFNSATFVGDSTKAADPPVVVKLRRSRSNVR